MKTTRVRQHIRIPTAVILALLFAFAIFCSYELASLTEPEPVQVFNQ